MTNPDLSNEFSLQNYFLFNAGASTPVSAFEKMTQLKVNQHDIVTYSKEDLEGISEESWWNDGWSNITFGTVSTGFGLAILCLATGPVGWVTGAVAVLAITGGVVSTGAGVVQLNATDPKTKKLSATVGDVALSLNNIPGLAVGTGAYVFTSDLDRSIFYANVAGIASGGASLLKSSAKAIGMQRLYNLNVGLHNSGWSSFTRRVNARLIGINPKGLEGSHLIPQRTVKKLVDKAPYSLKKPIENFFNGPFCINFMKDTEHALVDPHRWNFLPKAQKEILQLTEPFMANLMVHYPQLGALVGIPANLSPTAGPVINSLVLTTSRATKYSSMNDR